MEEINKNEITSKFGQKNEGTVGPLIASIIVIILLALGAVYYWGSIINKTPVVDEKKAQTIIPAETEISEIEKQIEELNFSEIDSELEQIELEMNSN